MMIHSSVQNKLPLIIETLKRHRVKKAFLFGSVCSDNFNPETSDMDILISFQSDQPFEGYADNFLSLEKRLEEISGRKIDLVVDTTLRNPFLIRTIEKTKMVLYE
jgi:predicted nucleotidyltransferase